VVAGRALSDASDAEIAIMMVEAGGTERSFSYYEDGAPKVTEEVLAEGLERPRPGSASRSTSSASWWPAFTAERGPITPMEFTHADRLRRRRLGPGRGGRHRPHRQGQPGHGQGRAQRRARRGGKEIRAALADEFPGREGEIKAAIRSLTKKLVRKRIVEDGVRIDGRGTADIRPLSAEIDLFPTAHGSALFQRGETQVLNVTTLGMPRMNQLLDTITPVDHKRYMHHYNFPPFSTGETGFMRGPKRREIGHGLLAERALLPVVPPRRSSPTPCVSSPTCWPPTARRRWRRSAARRCR
jgi:polyribonucleotide nucleotidyltransferase